MKFALWWTLYVLCNEKPPIKFSFILIQGGDLLELINFSVRRWTTYDENQSDSDVVFNDLYLIEHIALLQSRPTFCAQAVLKPRKAWA